MFHDDTAGDHKNSIMIVDDIPDNLRVLCEILKTAGYQIRRFMSVIDALASIQAAPPDLILLDIKMPELDGFEACRRLKSDERTKDIPVIFISGLTETAEKVTAFEVGGVDYITKPFQSAEILARVRTHLNLYRLTLKLEDRVRQRTADLKKANHKLVSEISERRQAEEALTVSEKQFRTLASNIPGVVYRCINDPVWTTEFMSNEIEKIVGYPASDFIKNRVRTAGSIIHPDDQRMVCESVQKALVVKEPYEFEYRMVHKNGTIKWVHEKGCGVFGENGELLWLDGIYLDITDRKQLEDNLQQSQKMESVGTLAGGVAHEFNNILAGIIGYTELAKDDSSKNSQIRDNLEEVLKLGNRAREVVRQILSFSRKGSRERKPIRMHQLIKEELKMLRATIPTTIEMRDNLNERSGTIVCDQTQIQQVGMNLCMNAAHAMEETGGLLEIGLSPVVLDAQDVKQYLDLKPGEYVKLTVSDTGAGIDPEIMDQIFDPFFTTKGVGKGTGMGLAVVYGIIKDHGGAIDVLSEPGQGTTFTVFLPKEEREIEEKKSADTILTGTENILVVDDEEHLVFLMKTILGRLGYKVTVMTGSLEALDLFKKDPQRYDLIITDLTMPHLTGDRLAAEVTAIRPDMPVIIATGYTDAVDSEKLKQSGIKAFIPKPWQKQDLAKTIRLILDET